MTAITGETPLPSGPAEGVDTGRTELARGGSGTRLDGDTQALIDRLEQTPERVPDDLRRELREHIADMDDRSERQAMFTELARSRDGETLAALHDVLVQSEGRSWSHWVPSHVGEHVRADFVDAVADHTIGDAWGDYVRETSLRADEHEQLGADLAAAIASLGTPGGEERDAADAERSKSAFVELSDVGTLGQIVQQALDENTGSYQERRDGEIIESGTVADTSVLTGLVNAAGDIEMDSRSDERVLISEVVGATVDALRTIEAENEPTSRQIDTTLWAVTDVVREQGADFVNTLQTDLPGDAFQDMVRLSLDHDLPGPIGAMFYEIRSDLDEFVGELHDAAHADDQDKLDEMYKQLTHGEESESLNALEQMTQSTERAFAALGPEGLEERQRQLQWQAMGAAGAFAAGGVLARGYQIGITPFVAAGWSEAVRATYSTDPSDDLDDAVGGDRGWKATVVLPQNPRVDSELSSIELTDNEGKVHEFEQPGEPVRESHLPASERGNNYGKAAKMIEIIQESLR